jgi:hypothetical protein
MRRRTQKYLPIVLIALMVQIVAPVGACWAAAIAASDPLRNVEICHDPASVPAQQDDQSAPHREHGSACAICCLASAGASIDTPNLALLVVPYRETAQIARHDQAAQLPGARVGSNAQARAPPLSV